MKGLDCSVCGDTVHIYDFRDNAAIRVFDEQGLCQRCQDKELIWGIKDKL